MNPSPFLYNRTQTLPSTVNIFFLKKKFHELCNNTKYRYLRINNTLIHRSKEYNNIQKQRIQYYPGVKNTTISRSKEYNIIQE